VPAEAFGVNARRQRLLTPSLIHGTKILLDRWSLGAGGTGELDVSRGNLVWFQIIEGEASLARPEGIDHLNDAHIVFLPPGFRGSLQSDRGATVLHAEVPDAARFDADFGRNPPRFRVVDWKQEPVLASKHDARNASMS
jgi:hypothetical protein